MTTAKQYQENKVKLFEAVNNIAREMKLRDEQDKIAIKNAIYEAANNILMGDGFDKIEVTTRIMVKGSEEPNNSKIPWQYYAYVTCRLWQR